MGFWEDAHAGNLSLCQALSTAGLLLTVSQHRQHAACSGRDIFWTLGSNSGLSSSARKSRCPGERKNCSLSAPFDG